MTLVNGQPVMHESMTSDPSGMYGSFTIPTALSTGVTISRQSFRPGDRVVIEGHGSPIIGTVRSVRWDPTQTDVEWVSGLMMWQKPASEIIDEFACELAERRPA